MISLLGYFIAGLLAAVVVFMQLDRLCRFERIRDAVHEIRGALTVIGFAINSNTCRSEQEMEALQLQVEEAARTLDGIASKSSSTDQERQLSVSEVLDHAVAAWRPVAAAHGRVLRKIGDQGLLIEGCRSELRQSGI